MSQHIFKNGQSYYLAEISPQGQLTLKVKEFGWSDTWSLPLDTCDHLGRTHEELTVGDCDYCESGVAETHNHESLSKQ